ncbi:MAG: hypothetical protein AB7U73_08285 [Pirellulales bacterium]
MRFEIYNEDGTWRWKLIDSESDTVIAQSVTEHNHLRAAVSEVEAIKAAVPGAWIDA